jgi:SAM-dependent MidA family methyltransferase
MKMPADLIREEIRKCGVISFARFMELALYCPETGYYESKIDTVGRRGDFITSVSVGSLFGELLAYQFAAWLTELAPTGAGVALVEAGAHGGQLAHDILAWLQARRPGLYERLEYVILEPSARRREWQREKLAAFAPRVRWLAAATELPAQSVQGICFSNELLDAFPVHRFGWAAGPKAWFEWGVGLAGENFGWVRLTPPAGGRMPLCPPELEPFLPDQYVVETCPGAAAWWQTAAAALGRGKLLAIDYGFSAAELFSPARQRGTLRAYHQHHHADDVLARPGEQDLTAHVNFPALQSAGEAAGLRTEQFCTQPQFLTRILQQAVADRTFASLEPGPVRQFQTLTHPEHLGRAFRVLVQGR